MRAQVLAQRFGRSTTSHGNAMAHLGEHVVEAQKSSLRHTKRVAEKGFFNRGIVRETLSQNRE